MDTDDPQQNTTLGTTTRTGRTVRPNPRYSGEEYATYAFEIAKPEYVAYKALSDPDTMYYHQAMAQPD